MSRTYSSFMNFILDRLVDYANKLLDSAEVKVMEPRMNRIPPALLLANKAERVSQIKLVL